MENTSAILWQNPDNNGNMFVRARMFGAQIVDDTFVIPIVGDANQMENNIQTAINTRMTEIANGTPVASSAVVNEITADEVIN